jgi:outer membrane lipoprotein SlyB
MSIREVAVHGGGSGVSNGTVVGGGLGAAGGAAVAVSAASR